MNYRYAITPRPELLGGGFKLQCFELNKSVETEMMGGVFATEPEAENEAIDWLNSQPIELND